MNLDEALKKYLHENFLSSDSFVYHYTKPESIKIIIDCGYLKLKSHHFLNKKNIENQELKVGVELIKEELKKSKNLRSQLNNFDDFIKRGITFFTSSFCHEEKSQHALKTYGESYIEFKAEFLRRYTIENKVSLFGSVKYDKCQQKKIISEMLGIYNDYKKSSAEPVVDLFTWLTVVIPLFKNKKHHKDNECRIIQAEIRDRNGELVTPSCSQKIVFSNSDIKIF